MVNAFEVKCTLFLQFMTHIVISSTPARPRHTHGFARAADRTPLIAEFSLDTQSLH